MGGKVVLYFLFFLFAVASSDNMLDMANERNIPIERHYVTTDDGYILGLYRLPPNNRKKRGNRTKTMFMMHGLTSASEMFILYPESSAGPFFQNLGYDVWIGNARGNTHSRNHTKLDPNDSKFWDFSWHEIGVYDLPAMIDYALYFTKEEQLIYIGHSQGVASPFVMLAERPGYNKKIAILHGMTPPVIMRYHHPVTPEEQNVIKLEKWMNDSRNYELFPYDPFGEAFRFLGDICPTELMGYFCRSAINFIPGPASPECYTDSYAADFATHMPAGISYRQLIHFFQISNAGRFQKYDFGPDENIRLYGSSTPPEYNFANIRAKIHILYGTHDHLVMQRNMPELLKKLQHAVVAVNKFKLFNHLDFAYGRLVGGVQQIILNVTERFVK